MYGNLCNTKKNCIFIRGCIHIYIYVYICTYLCTCAKVWGCNVVRKVRRTTAGHQSVRRAEAAAFLMSWPTSPQRLPPAQNPDPFSELVRVFWCLHADLVPHGPRDDIFIDFGAPNPKEHTKNTRNPELHMRLVSKKYLRSSPHHAHHRTVFAFCNALPGK